MNSNVNKMIKTLQESINTYDLLSDVTVTDNSGITPTIEASNNFTNLKGNYTVKYVATDLFGNVTTKLRKVTVK